MYDELKSDIKTNVYGNKKHKSFRFLFKDSFRYAFCRPTNLLILGFFLLLVSFFSDLCEYSMDAGLVIYLIIFFTLLAIILSIYESGYSFIVYYDSIHGIDVPPSPLNLKEILHHGTKDFTVILAYVIIMMILQFILRFFISFQSNFLIIVILNLISLFIGGFYIVLINLSLINLAFHDGDLKSAFNHHDLKDLFQSIGALRLFVALIVSNFVDWFVTVLFGFDYIIGVGILLDIFLLFILTPAMTLFTKRFLILSVLE